MPHLTPEAESDLAQRAKAGDRDAAAALVEANQHVIRTLAKRFDRETSVSRDDARQEGAIAVLKAIERFDPNAGTRFTSFCGLLIRNALRDLVRHDAKHSRERCGVRACDVEREGDLAEELARHNPPLADNEVIGVGQLVASLDARRRQLIEALYGIGRERLSTREIARRLNVNERTIKRRHAEALEQLRQLLHRQSLPLAA